MRSGVAGMSKWARTPAEASASTTALVTAGSAPTVPASPALSRGTGSVPARKRKGAVAGEPPPSADYSTVMW